MTTLSNSEEELNVQYKFWFEFKNKARSVPLFANMYPSPCETMNTFKFASLMSLVRVKPSLLPSNCIQVDVMVGLLAEVD